jgi:hypothetical protein
MWIEPAGFEATHRRGNERPHRLQDPGKWLPYGVGAIEGNPASPREALEPGPTGAPAKYAPGQEPRPSSGEPTGWSDGELL